MAQRVSAPGLFDEVESEAEPREGRKTRGRREAPAEDVGGRGARKPRKRAAEENKPARSEDPAPERAKPEPEKPAPENGRARAKKSAQELAERQREISVSEFFTKNRHLLGFDSPLKALLTAVAID